MYQPVGVQPGRSSMFVDPAPRLDPTIFDGTKMKAGIRTELIGMVQGFLGQRYMGAQQWLRMWLAGSGASYRWHAAQGLKDLDILLGVDYIGFRLSNRDFYSVGDREIAKQLNDDLRAGLWEKGWHGEYELTFYVNARSWDIRSINPYAAYDLLEDGWVVPPSQEAPMAFPEYEVAAGQYRDRAQEIVQRYSQHLTELRNSQNPAHRASAEAHFNLAVGQAEDLFNQVHETRRATFSDSDTPDSGWGNYLWQHGKQHGWLTALRNIKEYAEQVRSEQQSQTYGVELPEPDVLVRRAALAYRQSP